MDTILVVPEDKEIFLRSRSTTRLVTNAIRRLFRGEPYECRIIELNMPNGKKCMVYANERNSL